MQSIDFEGANHRFGTPRNWDKEKNGTCNDLMVQVSEGVFTSVWKPSPGELEMMKLGAKIVLHVWGGQPPVAVVMEFVDERESPEEASSAARIEAANAPDPVREPGQGEADA